MQNDPPSKPPPDDPGKRFAEFDSPRDVDPALAARLRLEALQSIRQKTAEQAPTKEEQTHGKEKSDEGPAGQGQKD